MKRPLTAVLLLFLLFNSSSTFSQNNNTPRPKQFSNFPNIINCAGNFSYQPYKNTTVYYRLKVTTVLGQTAYSNTIALRGISNTGKYFSVYNLVQNEVDIYAAGNYQYLLRDMNGRAVVSGTGVKGNNKVNVSNLPGGIYTSLAL